MESAVRQRRMGGTGQRKADAHRKGARLGRTRGQNGRSGGGEGGVRTGDASGNVERSDVEEEGGRNGHPKGPKGRVQERHRPRRLEGQRRREDQRRGVAVAEEEEDAGAVQQGRQTSASDEEGGIEGFRGGSRSEKEKTKTEARVAAKAGEEGTNEGDAGRVDQR